MRFLKTIGRSTAAVSILLQLFFSAYLSLLVIWTNAQAAKVPWVEKLQLLIAPGKRPHSFMDPELLHATAVLWGVLTLVVFLVMRVLSRFSNKLFFQMFVGIVATVGFPLAYMCTLQYNLFTVAEAVVAVVCVVLYSLQKWRLSKFWGVLLLSAHFALWIVVVLATEGSLRPGLTLLWPGYNLAFRQHPDLIYPALGFCSSLLWGFYVAQQRQGIGGRHDNFKQQASN